MQRAAEGLRTAAHGAQRAAGARTTTLYVRALVDAMSKNVLRLTARPSSALTVMTATAAGV